jgi:hypothetical protein
VFLVDGTTSPVSVSGVESGRSVIVTGFNGADLDLQATWRRPIAVRLQPRHKYIDRAARPPLNGGGVIKAVPFAGQR